MIRTPRGVVPVVALVMSLLLTACGEQKAAQEPDESATPSPTAAEKQADIVIDVADLEKGAAPKIGWRQDLTLHDGDRTVRLTGDELADVAVLGNRIITRGPSSSGDTEVQVRDSKGAITDRYPNPLSRLVTNSKRTIVAWIAEDNTPKVLQAGHRDPLDLPGVSKKKGDQGDAVAVLGNDCFHDAEEVEGAGCSVFFTLTSQDKRAPFAASNHGFVQEADTTITDLLDVSDDQALIGIVDRSAAKLCNRYESEAKSYETCDHVLSEFSPDGRSILGYSSEITEGPALDAINLLDAATGETRLTARSPAGSATIWETAWEDDEHVLAIVNQDETTWAIVRVGLDGKAELAAGPKDDAESTTVFGFAVQP
jgi:hypothetical protein